MQLNGRTKITLFHEDGGYNAGFLIPCAALSSAVMWIYSFAPSYMFTYRCILRSRLIIPFMISVFFCWKSVSMNVRVGGSRENRRWWRPSTVGDATNVTFGVRLCLPMTHYMIGIWKDVQSREIMMNLSHPLLLK